MKMKKVASFVIASMMAVSFVGCGDKNANGGNPDSSGSTAGDGDTITIGGIGPLTGEVAQYGVATFNGVQLAFDEQESLLGKKVVFKPYDDKGDAAESSSAYLRLVEKDNVAAILGAITSGATNAVANASQSYGTPLLTPTATAAEITGVGPNIFRGCFIDPYQGEIMAKYTYENLGLKKAAIIYNNGSDYSIGLQKAFEETFTALGGEITKIEAYADTDIDFKAQLSSIQATNPEALFIPDYYKVVALMAKQINDLGLEVALIGADGWDGIMDVVDDASILEGAVICNSFSSDDEDPKVKEFVDKYKAKYNGEVPNGFAASGYESAKIMFAAIEKAGSTDSEAIIAALNETDIEGLSGKITYDENRNPIKGAVILKIKDGKFEISEKVQ